MICLRCGYCCKNMCVVIVDDPKKGISKDNLIVHEGHGPCKHLQEEETGEYACAVHNESWYKNTPCFRHMQIEQSSKPCRMGVYVLKQKNELGVK